MGKIFITSDTFFGRSEILKNSDRPWKTVEEMNLALLDNWNSVVNPNDTVYHLGNFAWDPIICEEALSELNGNIKIVIGEYDDPILAVSQYFDNVEICSLQVFKEDDLGAFISHFPMEYWPEKEKGVFHLHGCIKSNLKTDINKLNRVNVCCDKWNYKPMEINELYELFSDFKKKSK